MDMYRDEHRRASLLVEQPPSSVAPSHERRATVSLKLFTPQVSEKGARRPVVVLLTGGAGEICYSLAFLIAKGDMFGSRQPVELRLFDLEPCMNAMEGLMMELQDCAFPLLTQLTCTCDLQTACTKADFAILIGAHRRRAGMRRSDLIKVNAPIFREHGQALDNYARRNVKVCVIGNPCNTNALVAQRAAPSLPATNFSSLSRLDENRAKAQVACKAGCSPTAITRLVVWGNHSSTQCPDVSFSLVEGIPIRQSKLWESAPSWLRERFVPAVQERGQRVMTARGRSSSASAARAIVDHMRDWARGTREGEWASMGVISDGSYGVPEGIFFSFPCVCKDGQFEIVQGLELNQTTRQQMQLSFDELLLERESLSGEICPPQSR